MTLFTKILSPGLLGVLHALSRVDFFSGGMMSVAQGAKAVLLGRQNERNVGKYRLALTFVFGLCFMSVYLIKSNCYSLIFYSLVLPLIQDVLREGVISNLPTFWQSVPWTDLV